MTENGDGADNAASAAALRDRFLAWQCELRRHAVREAEGRPSPGMCPRVLDEAGTEVASAVTLLLVRGAPAETTDRFRHIVRRTHDPAERREAALKFLAAEYYREPGPFSDRLTALFGSGSTVARRLVEARACRLAFAEGGAGFEVPCVVEALSEADPAWQATYWHNRLFNEALPPNVRVLGLRPDWARAEAEPPLG